MGEIGYKNYVYAKMKGQYIFKDKIHFDKDTASNYLMNRLNSSFSNAYSVNANNVESAAMEYFKSPQDFQQIIQLQKKILQNQYSQGKFFDELNNFVEKGLMNMTIDGVAVSKLNVYNPDMKVWERTAKIADDIDKVVNRLNGINTHIFNYLKSNKETANTVPPNIKDFFFLDKKEFATAKKQYNDVLRARKEIASMSNSPGSADDIRAILRKMSSSLTGTLRGSIKEMTSYISQTTSEDIVKDFSKSIGRNLKMSVDIAGNNIVTNSSGQIAKKYASKSDTVSYFYEVSPEKQNIMVGMSGVSIKSHSSKAANSKHHIAKSVRWDDLFSYAGLLGEPFEYLYLNSMIHTSTNLSEKKLNRYLAGKASAFLISGAFGGTTPNAAFVEYTDKVWYVPDLLKTMSGKGLNSRGLFNITPTTLPANINKVDYSTTDKFENALNRKNLAIKMARSKIKFNATGSKS